MNVKLVWLLKKEYFVSRIECLLDKSFGKIMIQIDNSLRAW